MLQTIDPNSTLATERVIPATPAEVFAAFAQAELLARWWGPDGFTNTIEQFDFAPGGRWVFVLHGTDGAAYPNENIFREIVQDTRIRIEHVVGHWFMLTMTLLGTVISPYTFEVLEEIRAPFAQNYVILLRPTITKVYPGDYAYMMAEIE